MSKQPSNQHQDIGLNIASALLAWSKAARLGRPTVMPGVIYEAGEAIRSWVGGRRATPPSFFVLGRLR